MLTEKPYISASHVLDALDALIHPAKTPKPNPLERLLVVDLLLADPSMPASPYSREFALQTLLLNIVEDELRARCASLNLLMPPENETRSAAEQTITDIAQSRSAELLLWTLLHYRYVRTDLGFTSEIISEFVSVDERSVRRYYAYAIRMLTKRLLQEEWAARTQHHIQQLYAALPRSKSAPLIGRDALLNEVNEQLVSSDLSHLYITGAPGTGKTAFATEIVKRLINTITVAHVIWLREPFSCDYVQQVVAQQVLESNTSLTLRHYTLRYRVVLVLDDAEQLVRQPDALADMLRELSAVTLVMITTAFSPLIDMSLHVPLFDLDQDATVALVRSTLPAGQGDLAGDDIAEWVFEEIGGNPLEAKTAALMLAYEQSDDVRTLAREYTVGRSFEVLDNDARLCWCALALYPPQGAALPELIALWQGAVHGPALGSLMRLYLVERVGDRYHLTTSAMDYIQQHHDDPVVQILFSQLITDLNEQNAIALDIIEHLLLSHSPFLTFPLEWTIRHWQAGLRRGHFAQWRTIFESMAAADLVPELQVAYGICLRRVGNWQQAEQVFGRAAYRSGFEGDFDVQSGALIESATLARLRGQYQKAVIFLKQADTPSVQDDTAIQERLWLEHIQIALDQGHGDRALEMLALRPATLYTRVLTSEAYLMRQSYEESRQIAEIALDHRIEDLRVEASLYTLIARSYEAEAVFDTAERYFALALTILESTDDVSAIARARANLAAILLRQERVVEAQALLDQAMPVLSLLEDRVGHAVALHNQRLTTIYFTR